MTDLSKINNIESSNNFEELFEFAKEKDFLKHLNKFAIPSLNLKKIKNFLIACLEEQELKTKLKSKPYRVIVDPTNACNLGCPLCPTGLGQSGRTKGILKFEKFKKIEN